jgi:hypothetical protein
MVNEAKIEVKREKAAAVEIKVDEACKMVACGKNGRALGGDIAVTAKSIRELCRIAGWFEEVNRSYERWRDVMWLLENAAYEDLGAR